MFSLLIMGGCSNDDEPKGSMDNEQTTIPNTISPQAVDLGLPSGTKWCDRNVGASSPEDNGGYFAWGETVEKKEYNLKNYPYFKTLPYSENGWMNIGNDISGTEYDVAHVRMGTPWRMPTVEQIEELYQYCTVKWVDGKGIMVTGPNGGQIFLPAAGYRSKDNTLDAGTVGNYWSGSLYPKSDGNAYKLLFGPLEPDFREPDLPHSLDFHGCYMYIEGRYCGLSVRAVCQ